jgi:hypothetical protein
LAASSLLNLEGFLDLGYRLLSVKSRLSLTEIAVYSNLDPGCEHTGYSILDRA